LGTLNIVLHKSVPKVSWKPVCCNTDLEMLLDIFAFICNSTWRYYRIAHYLKADLAAQYVRHVTFLPHTKTNTVNYNKIQLWHIIMASVTLLWVKVWS